MRKKSVTESFQNNNSNNNSKTIFIEEETDKQLLQIPGMIDNNIRKSISHFKEIIDNEINAN